MQDSEGTLSRQISVAPGIDIPDLTLVRELGRGGMAVVYEALDRSFPVPRPVAVKLMTPELNADPEFRARFEREASMLAQAEDPNIVRVYRYGETGGIKYMVMEFLTGGTLAQRIKERAVTVSDALKYSSQLACALRFLHGRLVVHRDFKPGNILFSGDQRAILADLGVAKSQQVSNASATVHGSVIGALRYMAPEQARGETVTDRADIYSFGLTLFEMLTGQLPPEDRRVLTDPRQFRGIRELLPLRAPTVGNLIGSCLMLSPSDRPSASTCVDVLSRPGIDPTATVTGTRGLIALGGAAAAVVAAGLFYFRHFNHTPGPTPMTASATPAVANVADASISPAPGTLSGPPSPSTAKPSNAPNALCPTPPSATALERLVNDGLAAQANFSFATATENRSSALGRMRQIVQCLQAFERAGISSTQSRRWLSDVADILSTAP